MVAAISDLIYSFYDYLKYLNLQVVTHVMDSTQWHRGTKNIPDPRDTTLFIVRQIADSGCIYLCIFSLISWDDRDPVIVPIVSGFCMTIITSGNEV